MHPVDPQIQFFFICHSKNIRFLVQSFSPNAKQHKELRATAQQLFAHLGTRPMEVPAHGRFRHFHHQSDIINPAAFYIAKQKRGALPFI
jgi:hypothetical protein